METEIETEMETETEEPKPQTHKMNLSLQKQRILIPNIFQYGALKELENFEKTKDRGIIIMPTGTGKTFLAALWFKKKLEENPNAKLLFICHNQDILSQANEKEFQHCLKDLDITYGYYNADNKEMEQATFGTVQTMARNLDKFSSTYFDYIIVDEAHHYQARTFKKVLLYFKPRFMLGLTATPYRNDGKSIFTIIGEKIYEAKIGIAIKKGILSKINYYCVDHDIDFSNIKWNESSKSYDEKDLNRKICIKEYDDAIIKEYKETLKQKYNKSKTICFCATVRHAYRMEKVFKEHGIKAVALCGKHFKYGKRSSVTYPQRKDIIAEFKNGKYDIIFVRDLFNEGVDIPDADSIMMLRPTQSHTIFTQQLGRGLRVHEGKSDVLILDFTGNARRCAINFEILSEMIELDIIKDVKINKRQMKDPSELVILNNGCEVRLSKRKIDVLTRPRKKLKDKEQLIDEYLSLKERLGRTPIATDMTMKNRVSAYETYAKTFGSWGEFKKVMGERLKKVEKKDVEKQFLEFFKQHGRFPSIRDLRKYKLISDNTIRRIYGTYAKCIESMGGIPLLYRKGDLPKEKILEDYYKMKEKLGRPPMGIEMQKEVPYSWSSALATHYGIGGHTKFLKEIGEYDFYKKTFPKIEALTKEETIKEYKEYLEKRGFSNYSYKDMSVRLRYSIRKHFGYLKDLNKQLGYDIKLKEAKEKSDRERAIKEYKELKEKLGRVPFSTDLPSVSLYGRLFGGWNKFLDFMGEPSERRTMRRSNKVKLIKYKPEPLSKEEESKIYQEYVKEYYRIKQELGRVPKIEELEKMCKFSVGSHFNTVFGTKGKGKGYTFFLKSIGDEPYFKRFSDQELIERYKKAKEKVGRIPFLKELKVSSDFFKKRFGGYNNFLLKIGESEEDIKSRKERVTEAEIIERFENRKKELKRLPKFEELNMKTCIQKKYGSYTNFLKQFGYDIKDCYNTNYKNTFLTKEDMVKEYKRVEEITKEKYNRPPILTDFCYKNKIAKFSEKLIRNQFGTWNKFLAYMGQPTFDQRAFDEVTNEDLLNHYKNLRTQLGRAPTIDEINKKYYYGLYYKRFNKKTWNTVKEMMGDKIEINLEDFKDNYFIIKKKLGRRPTQDEYHKNTPKLFRRQGGSTLHLGLGSIHHKFGTYVKFLKEIGEYEKKSVDKSKQEFIEDYKNLSKVLNKEYIPFWEFSKHTKNTQTAIESKFGSYNDLLKECEIKTVHRPKVTETKEDWINEYNRIKNELKEIPTRTDIMKYARYPFSSHIKLFGGDYNKFLKLVGDAESYQERIKKIRNTAAFNTRLFKESKEIEKVKEMYKNGMSLTDIGKAFNTTATPISKYLVREGIQIRNPAQQKIFSKKKPSKLNEEDAKEIKNRYIAGASQKELARQFKVTDNTIARCLTRQNIRLRSLSEQVKMSPKSRKWNRFTEEQLIEMKRKYLGGSKIEELEKEFDTVSSTIYNYLKHMKVPRKSNLTNRLKLAELASNIKITNRYKPKTIALPRKIKRRGLSKKTYNLWTRSGYKSNAEKVESREKIINKINDGDKVLLLEGEELLAIKEIEKQNKKPSKIVIPNNIEFKRVADSLRNYKTKLNIELINTSVLQYLVDNEEHFDLIWLDYCGAFSYYVKDLDVLFAKKLGKIKIILTYNLFDPGKEDENYYFTKVIDYVLEKVSGKSCVRLLNDITKRYKKNMYNVGFDIQEIQTDFTNSTAPLSK